MGGSTIAKSKKYINGVVAGGIVFLVLFSPLAFGSVHPWAFALMQATVFLLVAAWMGVVIAKRQGLRAEGRGQKSEVGGQSPTPNTEYPLPFALSSSSLAKQLALPLSLFLLFVLFQLLPLPPGVLRLLSPATYEVYTRSLAGWPSEAPYAFLLQEQGAKGAEQTATSNSQNPTSDTHLAPSPETQPTAPVILPTLDEFKSGVPIPFEEEREDRGQGSEDRDQTSVVSGQTSAVEKQGSGVSGQTSAVEQQRSASGQNSAGNPESGSRSLISERRSLVPDTWFPLSLSPSRTRSDFLKFACYAALFFLVLLYPFRERHQRSEARGQKSETRGRRTESSASSFRNSQSAIRNSSPLFATFPGTLLVVIVFAGFLIAALGFVQRFTWNGKILWFFVPYDWGIAQMARDPRASGPFINPDHYANYLALVFPLAVGLFIHARRFVAKEVAVAFRIFCGLTAFLAFTSILLSLSRSGWMISALGIALLFWFSPSFSEHRQELRSSARNRLALRAAGIVGCALLIISLLFVGSGGRQQVDRRLQQTVTQDMGVEGRVDIWRDSLKMARDFPLFGVGLGSWQDLFQRYQSPPWSPQFYREAHNDYIELLAETGVIGFVLLGWFFVIAGKRLFTHARFSDSKRSKAILAMLIASLSAMAFHEFFDFNLQIPANAFLFTVLLALGLRICMEAQKSEVRGQTSEVSESTIRNSPFAIRNWASRYFPVAVCTLALVLFVAALNQQMIPYPHYLTMPGSIAEAKEMITVHPALPTPHVYMLRLLADKAPLEAQLNEARTALWLNPTSPGIRDVYALTLLQAGKEEEGLNEVSESVFNAPMLSAHYFLNGRILPWMSDEEKHAVEVGFNKALQRNFPGAMENYAGFLGTTGRFADQGKIFEQAAARSKDKESGAELMIKAASSYLQDKDDARAEQLLQRAASATPKDPRPYQMLAVKVYGPRQDRDAIAKTIAAGLERRAPAFELHLAAAEAMHNAEVPEESRKALVKAQEALQRIADGGQEPFRLYVSLADTALRMKFRDEAKAALRQALDIRPSSPDVLNRLANISFQENKPDEAAYYLKRYVELYPDAPDAFFRLALAEERQYRFAAAGEAYARAVKLAPENTGYRERYYAFRTRVEQNRAKTER